MAGTGGSEEPLLGGIANLGAVVRVGDTVRRPSNPHTESVFALLRHLHEVGFDHVPYPAGIDEHGREVVSYIQGDVPIPRFPEWSMTNNALASVARLQRRFHDAVAGFDAGAHTWSDDIADPVGGTIVGHNDICPENVVFRGGEAVAFLDWDFAAPGRPLWDVAAVMSMWGPFYGHSGRVPGMERLDPFARARLIADAYGMDPAQRAQVPNICAARLSISLVERRAAAGEPAFIEMLASQGGEGRAQRRRDWLALNMNALRSALMEG